MFARFARNEGGASATEFALISPVFLALIFGLFQVGWALHCASSVRYALEEGARAVMLDKTLTASAIKTQMRNKLDDIADPEIEVSMTTTSQVGMQMVNLNATYVHHMAVPFLPEWDITFNQTTSVARPT